MNAQHAPGPDEIAAFRLAIDDGISDVGMTYDNDPESPRSVAYDVGRTVAELPEPWQSLLAAAPAMLAALLEVKRLRDLWRSQDDAVSIDSIAYMDGLDRINVDAVIAGAKGS